MLISKYFTPNVVTTILGVVLICVLVVVYYRKVEGFAVSSPLNGSVPSAPQTSMISSDVAGATSSDPTLAKAQPKDVLATMESLNNLVILATSKDAASTDIAPNMLTTIQNFKTNAPQLNNSLQSALANPDASVYTVKNIADMRNEIEALSAALRSAKVVLGPTKPAGANPYSLIGCYGDQPSRAIPTNEGDPALAEDYHVRQNPIDQCYKVANSKGHKVFAVQDGGWCASAPTDDPAQYGKYGVSQGCNSNGTGGSWANSVYRITPAQPAALDLTPTVVAGPPGQITLKDLHDLHNRVGKESMRLSNLRSTSPTLTNRISLLEKLSADLGDIITALERGQMNLEDVPIKPDTAQKFLAQLSDTETALPTLITPEGAPSGAPSASESVAMPQDMMNSNPALQALLQNAQYLKWNVQLNLEFNPETAQKGRLISRLEEMEKRLTNLAISETPVPKELYDLYNREMKTIQAIMNGTKNGDSSPRIELPATASTRLDVPFSTADYPSSAQLSSAQGGTMQPKGASSPHNELPPDVQIRPGFLMNDNTIAQRASASAFDPSTVGGPDYKKRSLDLCQQLQGAHLGDPANLGCIKNPAEVSADYSWKGNYKMVCNRIGDTWGAWYPEMFGCPKYDPTAKFQGNMM
jgi:hypothetical protein